MQDQRRHSEVEREKGWLPGDNSSRRMPTSRSGGGGGFYSYLGTWPMNLDLLGGKPRMRLLAKAGSVDGLACVGKRLRKIILPTLPELAKGEVWLFLHQCYLTTMLMLPNINDVKVFVKWGRGEKPKGEFPDLCFKQPILFLPTVSVKPKPINNHKLCQ